MLGQLLRGGVHRRTRRELRDLRALLGAQQRTARPLQLPARHRAQPQRPLRALQEQVQLTIGQQLGALQRRPHQARIAQAHGRRGDPVPARPLHLLDPRMQHPSARGDRPGAARGDTRVQDRLPAQLLEQRRAPTLVVPGQPGQEGAHALILPHDPWQTHRPA